MSKNLYIISGCNGAEKTIESDLKIYNEIKFYKATAYYYIKSTNSCFLSLYSFYLELNKNIVYTIV